MLSMMQEIDIHNNFIVQILKPTQLRKLNFDKLKHLF